MAKVTHYLITNREVSDVGRDNYIQVGKEFLRIDGRESAHDNLRFGEIAFEETHHNKDINDFEISLYPDLDYEALRNNTEKQNLSAAEELSSYKMFNTLYKKHKTKRGEKEDILFFVHGYKNDLVTALQTLSELHNLYVKPKDSTIKHIVLFAWPSRKNLLQYRDDARDAILSGYALARAYMKLRDFFRILLQNNKDFCMSKIHLICHSMGNRVIESMLEHLNAECWTIRNLFEEGILVGADVDYDTLEPPKPMNHIIDLCARVHVYYHRRDKALMVSENTKNAFNRLGLWGAKNTLSIPDDVYQCNVTDIPDPEDNILDDLEDRIINHWYYINNSLVVNDIRDVLNGKVSVFSDTF
ncbi:alpha/beta hydrolase [Limibacter armeniacum]|uniref:alpha/beta hydrolase n=1 Tax=Limibacter armeniacum TaxID=466084 RepID=UPI002FE592C5